MSATKAWLEDLLFMVETGESPEMICQRLGIRPYALARRLARAGRPDLTGPFRALHKRERARK